MTQNLTDIKKKALSALAQVEDPDLKKDLVTLGMVEDLQASEKKVSFTLVLTTPACPLKEVIRKNCEQSLRSVFEKELEVHINFSSKVTSRQTKKDSMPSVKNIVGVFSGKGGVGKSTLAANLAVALSKKGAAVGLLDADIFGPSLPTLFACRGEKPHIFKKENRNCLMPLEQYGVKLMSIGFLVEEEQAVMWRGPMASTALGQLLGDTEWGELDYLLVDMPPGTSDIPITLAQKFPLNGMLIVSTPQELALADVRKSISMCRQPQLNIPILGIIENMAYFITEDNPSKRYYLFGEEGARKLAEESSIPFLGEVPIYSEIVKSSEQGYPAVLQKGPWQSIFLNTASKLAQQIALHNAKAETEATLIS